MVDVLVQSWCDEEVHWPSQELSSKQCAKGQLQMGENSELVWVEQQTG